MTGRQFLVALAIAFQRRIMKEKKYDTVLSIMFVTLDCNYL
jgi:hypothetical protein